MYQSDPPAVKMDPPTQENGSEVLEALPTRARTEWSSVMPPDDSRTPASPTTPTTRVVHITDPIPDAVYVGRPNNRWCLPGSPFANPFKIGATLPTFEGRDDRKATRRDVVVQYELWIMSPPQRSLLAQLPSLRGKAIACWCRHDGEERTEANACHADVLVDLLNRYTDEELRKMAVQS